MDEMTHTDRARPGRKLGKPLGDRRLHIKHSAVYEQCGARAGDLLRERTGVTDAVSVQDSRSRAFVLRGQDGHRSRTHADRHRGRGVVACGGDQPLDGSLVNLAFAPV